MAIIKAVSSHAPVGVLIDYVEKREKTESRLLSGLGLSPETAKDEMESTKEIYGKTGGRTYKHFVQSFAPDENITPDEAHKLANEFAEKCEVFKGYEVLIATHKDRNHIHTHYVVNSVSFENGQKFQMSAHDLQNMKDLSDDLCREKGLCVCEKGKTFKGKERTGIVAWTKEKYQYLQKIMEEKTSKSYVRDAADAVKESMYLAKSKDDFCSIMKEKGYEVDWQDKHKHITFKDENGNKVRDTNLNKTFNIGIGKEELEQQFKNNSVSVAHEKLSFYKSQAIASDYRLHEYESAKKDIDDLIKEQKIRVEVTVEKHNKAVTSIKNTKEEIKQWTKEQAACSPLQFMKKHNLQEQIDHGNALIDSIRADRDEFLDRYGFHSVEEMKAYADDYYKASKTSSQLEQRIAGEQKVRSSYEYTIKKVTEENPQNIECSTDDMKQIENQLKEEFGEDFLEDKLLQAERRIDSNLKKNIPSGGDESKDIQSQFQEKKEEIKKVDVEKSENEQHEEVHHHGRGR